jgi:NADH:ubiquinone oxidoreductase subunit 3 (subunit A)
MPSAAPSADFLTEHSSILTFLVIVIGFLVANLIAWKLIRPSRYSEEKLTTYE